MKRQIKKLLFQPDIPEELQSRFRTLDETGLERLRQSLSENFYKNSPPGFLCSEEGKRDLADHMSDTLERNRNDIIPWLNTLKKLEQASILEIGCGTGATAVALAEQGADVTAIDIDNSSIAVARDRCDIYDLNVRILEGNATEISKTFSGQKFDFIIFYASLEHMTHEERLTALADAWSMLSINGILTVIEAPNRLWYFDSHTSGLPFYNWLPDDVALKYSRFSARKQFNELSTLSSDRSYVELMRWGRGVSYHEFELAIDGIVLDQCVSCNSRFNREQKLASRIKWRFSRAGRFSSLLHSMRPDISSGFFEPYLNISIRKT